MFFALSAGSVAHGALRDGWRRRDGWEHTTDVTGKVGGYQTRYRRSGQGFGHVGGGVEYRITSAAGVFTDARYLFSGVDGLPDARMLCRFGVRGAF